MRSRIFIFAFSFLAYADIARACATTAAAVARNISQQNPRPRYNAQELEDVLSRIKKDYRLSVPTIQKLRTLMSRHRFDPTVPAKIAKILGIQYLIHITNSWNLQFILRERGLISGVKAKRKYDVYPVGGMDAIGTFRRSGIFFTPLRSNWRKTKLPEKMVLYFDIELLNDPQASASPAWNFDNDQITFRNNPILFLRALAFPVINGGEVKFPQKISIDHLRKIVLKKKPHKCPSNYDPDMWSVPYLEVLEYIEKARRRSPKLAGLKEIVEEANYFPIDIARNFFGI